MHGYGLQAARIRTAPTCTYTRRDAVFYPTSACADKYAMVGWLNKVTLDRIRRCSRLRIRVNRRAFKIWIRKVRLKSSRGCRLEVYQTVLISESMRWVHGFIGCKEFDSRIVIHAGCCRLTNIHSYSYIKGTWIETTPSFSAFHTTLTQCTHCDRQLPQYCVEHSLQQQSSQSRPASSETTSSAHPTPPKWTAQQDHL